MTLEGNVYVSNNLIGTKTIHYENPNVRFSQELSEALVLLCKELAIPVPMWLSANTQNFAQFHQTVFYSEQFAEEVLFDKFQIRWEA